MSDRSHEYDPSEPQTGLFHWYLEKWAAKAPTQQAYTYSPLAVEGAESEAATWGSLNESAAKLATSLADAGVEAGDAVVGLFPPSPQFAVTYFAAAKLGAMLVPLDLRGTPDDHQYVLSNVEATAFVGVENYRGTDFRDVLANVPAFDPIGTTLWLGDNYEDALTDVGEYEWTVCSPSGDPTLDDATGCTDPDAPLLVVFTSGTTGDPKGAVLSHRNAVFQGTAISATWDVDSDDTVLVQLPTDHVGGATELMGTVAVSGADAAFLDAFDPTAALSLMEQHGVSVVGNVPAMWGMLFNDEAFPSTDLSSLSVAIVAGQAPSEDILRGMAECADDAVTGWGLTETGGFVTLTELGTPVSELVDSVGTPFPGFELQVLGDDGAVLDQGETGELVVRGDGVMDRYLDAAETDAAFVDGDWVRTGDLAMIDDDGTVRLRGRKKNMYISGGYNVYPPEIEDHLTDHPDIEQAMVIGVEHPEWGEAGHAFILKAPDSDLGRAAVENHVEESLASYKQPAEYTIEEELPLTSLGKVDRQALIEDYDLDVV